MEGKFKGAKTFLGDDSSDDESAASPGNDMSAVSTQKPDFHDHDQRTQLHFRASLVCVCVCVCACVCVNWETYEQQTNQQAEIENISKQVSMMFEIGRAHV